MFYEELKNIEKLLEGNEFFDSGVTYYIGIDKLDESLPMDIALKRVLIDCNAIDTLEENIDIISIENPMNEMQKLCEEWHLNNIITRKMLKKIDDKTQMYRFCEDYEYISKGCVGEIYRIIKKGRETVLIDFYIVD